MINTVLALILLQFTDNSVKDGEQVTLTEWMVETNSHVASPMAHFTFVA